MSQRLVFMSVVAALGTALAAAAPVAASAPSNDLIATPRVISVSTISGSSGDSNVGATFVHEPTPTCQTNVGAAVWYRYRPTALMDVTLDTAGSNFDTVLVEYESTETGLVQGACADDNIGQQSAIAFTAAANTAYYIMVAGWAGVTGTIQLNYDFHIANDAFARATTIKPRFTSVFNNVTASAQSGEPGGCNSPGRTVWYKYKPTANRNVTFDTFDSNFDTQINVYRGTSLGGLVSVVCADDTDDTNGDGSVVWKALKNKTYYIQVDGYQDLFGELHVNFARTP